MADATKQYEMMILLHPDLEIDLDKPQKQIEELIKSNGGSIQKSDVWGKRKLAYTIQGNDYAVYVFYKLDLPGPAVGAINSELNIRTEVLRHLIVEFNPKLEEYKKLQAERAAKREAAEAEGSDSDAKQDDSDESKGE